MQHAIMYVSLNNFAEQYCKFAITKLPLLLLSLCMGCSKETVARQQGAVKPTRNLKCWHNIGAVERCPESGHYLSRNLT